MKQFVDPRKKLMAFELPTRLPRRNSFGFVSLSDQLKMASDAGDAGLTAINLLL